MSSAKKTITIVGDDGRYYQLTEDDLTPFEVSPESELVASAQPYLDVLRNPLIPMECVIAATSGQPNILLDLKKFTVKSDE